MMYVITFFTIIMQFLSATNQDSPCRDHVEIAQKLHSNLVIFTTSVQKSQDACGMSLRVPYHYLVSLPSFLWPKWLSKSLRCPQNQYAARTQIMWSTCDMSTGCGLAIFQNLSWCIVNSSEGKPRHKVLNLCINTMSIVMFKHGFVKNDS